MNNLRKGGEDDERLEQHEQPHRQHEAGNDRLAEGDEPATRAGPSGGCHPFKGGWRIVAGRIDLSRFLGSDQPCCCEPAAERPRLG